MATRFWVGGTDTWDNTAGSKWASSPGGAGGESVPTSADNVFIDALSGVNTVTIGITAQALTLSMSGFTGTLAFGTNKIQLSGNAATIFQGATGYSVTGTPLIECIYSGTTGTRTISPTNVAEARSISFSILAGGDAFAIISSSAVRSLDLTGFTGSWSPSTTNTTFYGNLTLVSGMTFTAGTGLWTFAATSGTQVITSAGLTLGSITQNTPGATLQLNGNVTLASTRTFTLTSGTLDLANNTLSTGLFSSTNSNVRSIAFGTGNITLTGFGTVWNGNTATNFTCTGSRTVNLTYAGSSSVTINAGGTGGSANTALDFNITAGTYAITIGATTPKIRSLNFTGFTGTWNPGSISLTLYGSLTLVAGMTFTEGTGQFAFAGTSGTQTITSAGKTLRRLLFSGVGGTYELADNLTVSLFFDFDSGTFNTNGYDITALDFASSSGLERTLNLSNSTITILNSWSLTGGNFDAGTSTILMSPPAAGTYTFSGGQGYTYYNLVIGSPSVTGQIFNISNGYTVNTISSTKTVAWTLIISAQNTRTITFSNWAINGTSGNLVTLNSSVAGTRAKLVKSPYGIIVLDYMNIKDIEATPAAGGSWYATNSIDSGNNSGWIFGYSPNTGASYFLMF